MHRRVDIDCKLKKCRCIQKRRYPPDIPEKMRFLAVLALLPILFGGAAPDERPNILVIMADDWSWLHAGAYGDQVVATPNMDRVARQGVVFEHAFVSSPSCTPSRASVLTGQHFWRLHGGGNLYGPLGAQHPTYTDLLEAAGYYVGFTRKGWSPGRLGERDRNPAGDRYESFAAFLEAREKGQPFSFWFGTFDPHRVYELGSGEESGIPVDSISVPAVFPDVPAVRSDIADYYFEVQRIDRELGELLDLLEGLGELDRTVVVITSDNGMPFPRAKGNLYDLGVRVPLIVQLPEIIPGGRRLTDLVSLTDLAPTFLEMAGLAVPEQMTGRSLVASMMAAGSGRVDSSRVAAYFGRERHTPAQASPIGGGYPMRAIRTDDFLYIHNFAPERWPAGTPDAEQAFWYGAWYSDIDASPTKHFMVDSAAAYPQRFKAAFGKRPGEELYDLATDPDQMINRALDPAYADVKRALWNDLMGLLQRSGDPRAVGMGGVFDYQPYTGGIVRRPKQ